MKILKEHSFTIKITPETYLLHNIVKLYDLCKAYL